MQTCAYGLMGAGKTYGVVKEFVIPACYIGRKVFTNIRGLNPKYIHKYLIKFHKKEGKNYIKRLKNEISQVEIDIKHCEDSLELIELNKNLDYKKDVLDRLVNFNITVEDIENNINVLDADRGKLDTVEGYLETETFNFYKRFHDPEIRNSLYLVDEAQLYFNSTNLKTLKSDVSIFYRFVSEQRHIGLDFVLITQAYKNLDSFVVDRLENIIYYKQQANIGLKGSYLEIYKTRVDSSSYEHKNWEVTSTATKKYDKDVFLCYKSVRAGSNSISTFDPKALITNVKFRIIALLSVFFFILYGVFFVYDSIFNKDYDALMGISRDSNNEVLYNQAPVRVNKPQNNQNTNINKSNFIPSTELNSQDLSINEPIEEKELEPVKDNRSPFFKQIAENYTFCSSSFFYNDDNFMNIEINKNNIDLISNINFIIDSYSIESSNHLFRLNLHDLINYHNFTIKIISNCNIEVFHDEYMIRISKGYSPVVKKN